MKNLDIITLPHQHLRQPSRKIGLIDGKIKALAKKMIDQAIQWEKDRRHENTVGLAAVQIDQPLRIIIIRKNLDDKTPASGASFQVLINPQITKYAGEKTIQIEGCLSVPKYYTNIERHEEVRVSALDLEGNPLRFRARGFTARIMQHEVDHLKGIMTVDRAVENKNEKGELFTFCRLDQAGRLKIVSNAEVRKTGILKDD